MAAEIDPITFEVIRHRLWAINDEQGRMAARLSGAPIIYEAYDLNAALMTPDGRGLCCGVFIMHHGATIDGFVRRVIAAWPADEIRPGDMFFTNDPWWGALHANDGILAMPVFAAGELVAWSGIVMHDSDVGSPVPGSFVAGARDRFAEAPLFPAIKLVENFEPRVDIERAYLRNSRTPDQNALNMRARVAALRTTYARLGELVERYGLDVFKAAQEGVIAYVERVLRRRLGEIPDGVWLTRGFHDHDGVSDSVYEIRCALTKAGERLRFDLSGTAAQAPGPINCARPALEGVIAGVLLTFLCHDLPWAIGGLTAIAEIEVPEGTIVSARSPAAVSMASIMAALSAQDVVANAVAQMLLGSQRHRGEAQATWSPGICGTTVAARAPDGASVIALLSESFGGGGGARSFNDGVDSGGVFHSMGSRIANVESLESRAPLLELYRREAPDSAGAGRFRGGAGLEFAVTPHKLADARGQLITRSSGVTLPAGHGLAGGHPGAPASQVVLRGSNVAALFAGGVMPARPEDLQARALEVLEAKSLTPFAAGDVLFARSPGGAGFGDPLERERAAVVRDVASGLVSGRAAAEVYGCGEEGERSALLAGRRESSRPGQADAAACPRCGARQTLVRELALASLGTHFAHCREDFALREVYCADCASALSATLEPLAAPARGG
jgi:N-methylhydantoinase B